jgi:hypothetical protein
MASQENLNASLKEHAADLERAEMRLKALGSYRVSGTIEADIAKLKQDRLWDSTKGCTEATLTASRGFCKGVEALRAELALAAADTVLTAKIEGLRFKIEQLRRRGAGRESDPQLGEIARAAGVDILRVRSGMNWLLAIAVEMVSCFGLFVVAWHREPRAAVREADAASSNARPWRLVRRKAAESESPTLRLPARKGMNGAGPNSGAALAANGRAATGAKTLKGRRSRKGPEADA